MSSKRPTLPKSIKSEPVPEGTPSATPPQSDEVGELTVGEMRLLEQLRNAATQTIMEIGNLEVRKSQLLTRLNQIEMQGQSVAGSAAKRLNIPDGDAWHVTSEGKVRKGLASA